jgi:carbon storage regulator
MLVLTRRASESVVIDGRIRIIVLEVEGNRVQLGFAAPKDVVVLRGEVWRRKVREIGLSGVTEGVAGEAGGKLKR